MENKMNNLLSYIESGCDDIASSKEWVKIQEIQVLEAKDTKRLIDDYISKIMSFKLVERLENLKKEQKELEKKGKIEESIKLALEYKEL
jgi:DNA primase